MLFSSITLLLGIASSDTKAPCRRRFCTLVLERSHERSNFLHLPVLPGVHFEESLVTPVRENLLCVSSPLIVSVRATGWQEHVSLSRRSPLFSQSTRINNHPKQRSSLCGRQRCKQRIVKHDALETRRLSSYRLELQFYQSSNNNEK